MILGLDVGGTNIDALIVSNNKIIKTIKKELTNDLFLDIFNTIKMLTKNINKSKIKTINLSTTISTNAIYLNKINKVGLIVQTGPGLPHSYLKVNNNTKFISGYVDHLGRLIEDFNNDEIININNEFKNEGIKDLAIISKFSTRNNITEEKLFNQLKNDYNYITLGHLMSGKLNFPRRINTAYLNSSISELFNNFANNLIKALKELNINANINILKADGGIINLNYALNKPVETILSGPAASLMGTKYLLNTKNDSIILDIGGTTTDIFFLKNGEYVFEPLGIEIKNYKTLIRSIYSKSIPYGGDSIVDSNLNVLPKRLDKAYAFGGKYLTVTDFLLVLNNDLKYKDKVIRKIEKKYESINTFKASKKVINDFLSKIYNSSYETLKLINNKPVYTINELILDDKINPKDLIVIGNPSKYLKNHLKDKFNLNILIPKYSHIANAIGAAFSIQTLELNLYANTYTKKLSIPEINYYKNINYNFNLSDAKKLILKKIEEEAKKMANNTKNLKYEITEEETYNTIDETYNTGINIRLKAQIRPDIKKDLII